MEDDKTPSEKILQAFKSGDKGFEVAVLEILSEIAAGVWSAALDLSDMAEASREDDGEGRVH